MAGVEIDCNSEKIACERAHLFGISREYLGFGISREYLDFGISREYLGFGISREYLGFGISREYLGFGISREYLGFGISREYLGFGVSREYLGGGAAICEPGEAGEKKARKSLLRHQDTRPNVQTSEPARRLRKNWTNFFKFALLIQEFT